ncbi:MAG: DNA polymerase III subunit gamma/tau [Desulfococcaceae bacterium]
MSYLVLARKYRPQTFEEVVNQTHVTRTLENAVAGDRVAHAILFAGPRGTGKTTIARILAKAMNCEKGPRPQPCNTCRSCREITTGHAVDVFEIDGASNNGVDHIRDLRENIKYMPAQGRYKIYIIDEVHMLSTPAFNALLKTLEEPPAHVLFFFATTEPHKIPITILSRCQRHDLRRIGLEEIVAHMETLSDREGIEIPRESLAAIARSAGGSMRDGLSLLDHVMACAEGPLTHPQVLDILGAVDGRVLFDISGAVLAGDLNRILKILDDIHDHGHNLKEFYAALLTHFRNLLVVKMGKQARKLVDASAREIEEMARQVERVSQVYLSQLLDALTKEETALKFATLPKLTLEMAFIRMFQIKPALSIETLIHKIDQLSRGIMEGTVPATAEAVDRVGGETREEIFGYADAPPAAPEQPPKRAEATPSPAPPADSPPPVPDPDPVPNVRGSESPDPERPGPASPDADHPRYDAQESPKANWSRLKQRIADKQPSLAPWLAKTELRSLAESEGVLELEVNGNHLHFNRIQKNQENITTAAGAFFGRDMRLVIHPGKTPEKKDLRNQVDEANRKRQEALNHPMVSAALEIFEGKLEEVKLL